MIRENVGFHKKVVTLAYARAHVDITAMVSLDPGLRQDDTSSPFILLVEETL